MNSQFPDNRAELFWNYSRKKIKIAMLPAYILFRHRTGARAIPQAPSTGPRQISRPQVNRRLSHWFALFTILSYFGLLPFPAKADPIEDALAKGLLAEEAQHDLKAAATAYEEAVRLGDRQRGPMATALFRLAESQRRLGMTNEAIGNYDRLVSEFPDQTNLVGIARQRLSSSGVSFLASGGSGSLGSPTGGIAAALRQNEGIMERLKRLPANQLPAALSALYPSSELGRLVGILNDLNQQHAAMQTDYGPENVDRKKLEAKIKETRNQLDRQIDGIVTARQMEIEAQKTALSSSELKAENASADQGSAAANVGEESREIAQLKKLFADSPDLIEASEDGPGRLAAAASRNQTKVIDFLLSQGTDVNSLGKNGPAPLYAAAKAGHKRIVEQLLKVGAKVDRGMLDGTTTPLHAAVEAGHRQVVSTLVAAGANLNAETRWNFHGRAVLGITPLGIALDNRDAAMVATLLDAGADPNKKARNNDPQEPLRFAISQQDWESVELLLKSGAKVDFSGVGASVFINDHPLPARIADSLLSRGADVNGSDAKGRTALYAAAWAGWVDYTRWLLSHGANPNALTPTSQNPLHVVLETMQHVDNKQSAAWQDRRAVVDALVTAKADVNKLDQAGRSPLWLAFFAKSKEIADKLIAAGANPNERSPEGLTLSYAVVADWPDSGDTFYPDFAALLAKSGADLNAPVSNYTPLELAIHRVPNCAETLLRLGADPNAKAPDGMTPLLDVKQVLEPPHQGIARAPLTRSRSHYEAMERLLREAGARDDATNRPSATQKSGPGKVLVFGAISAEIKLEPESHRMLSEAVTLTNPSEFMDLKRVRLHRPNPAGGETTTMYDVSSALKKGDRSNDVELRDGDRIEIVEKRYVF